MKRVLSSGFIKVHQILGTEKERLDTITCLGYLGDKAIEYILFNNPAVLDYVEFRFEVKAPLLTLLDFQDAHLGTISKPEDSEHQVAYLPSQFYSKDGLTYKIMDVKSCNAHYTKLNNFFEWSFNFYNKLVKEGMCQEQAKLVLPQGVFVTFMWNITAKDLIEFIEQHYNDSPEIYGYCSTFVLYLEEHLPLTMRYLKAHEWQHISL